MRMLALKYFFGSRRLVFRNKELPLLYRVGTVVANKGSEGSFLIPGRRQRQTLSPLLNPAGNLDFFCPESDPKSLNKEDKTNPTGVK